MHTVTQQAVDGLERARTGDLGERLSDVIGLLTDYVTDATKAADDIVRSSPWRAIGAVALAGIAVGILVARNSRRADPSLWERGRERLSEVSGG
jgi:ElaB/YqjD/DUF883 family membrane-anchored ribosome-binding protein